MIVACDENKVQLQIGFNQRFWSQVQIVKRLLDMNFIGKIHSFRTIYSEKYSVFPAATPYRYILDQSGGATIIDLAIHRIDMIRYLLGEYKSLVAELKHSEIPAKVDDNVHILVNMKSIFFSKSIFCIAVLVNSSTCSAYGSCFFSFCSSCLFRSFNDPL